MRILVAAPPKTGNVWIKHILAAAYDLKILDEIPGRSAAELKEFVDRGRFRDRSIFHQHFHPEPALFDSLKKLSPHVVTTNRNPYDAFVSLYFFAQRHQEAFKEGHPVHMMVNKPVDHPDVLAYLEKEFPYQLTLMDAWIKSKESLIVSYEDLFHDPYATVERLTRQIKPVSMSKIRKAVDISSADVLKKRAGYWNVHIRTATVGDWQSTLTEPHLEIFRRQSELIKSIGYDVV